MGKSQNNTFITILLTKTDMVPVNVSNYENGVTKHASLHSPAITMCFLPCVFFLNMDRTVCLFFSVCCFFFSSNFPNDLASL